MGSMDFLKYFINILKKRKKKVIMQQIISLIQLQQLNNETNLNEVQGLKIQLNKEKAATSTLLSQLLVQLTNLTDLILHLQSTGLTNQFLSRLQQMLKSMHNLKTLDLHFHKNQFKGKQVIQFILAIKERFYNNDGIEYSFVDDLILITCGTCRISFTYNPNSSIFIKGLKDKNISIVIAQKQCQFKKIIKNIIKYEIDNLHVTLKNEDFLIDCNNGSPFFKLKITLIFENKYDLFNFPINNHTLIRMLIPENEFKDNFKEQINKRYNFSMYSKDKIFILSFKKALISQNQKTYLKEIISQTDYFAKISSTIFLTTELKKQILTEVLLPLILKDNQPIQFNLILNQDHEEEESLLVKIDKHTINNVKRKILYVRVRNFQFILDLLKNFFDRFTSENDYKFLKLTFNNQHTYGIDYNNLHQQIADLDTNIRVRKLKIYQSKTKIKYPLIQKLKNLEKLSIRIFDISDLVQFVNTNKEYLKFDRQKSLYDLRIQFLQYYYEYYHRQNQVEFDNCTLDRIANVYLFYCQNIPKMFTPFFKKFKRLVNCKLSEKENYNTQKNYENLDESNECYYDDDYYYYINRCNYNEEQIFEIAYLNVDNHDDITCSIYKIHNCVCSKNQIQSLFKQYNLNQDEMPKVPKYLLNN